MEYFQALIIAIIEGITEFLPISSTGHMVIASSLINVDLTKEFVKLYIVCIQLGAILSVVVLYYKRFIQSIDFYLKLMIAFIPIAIAGLLLKKYIEQALESVLVIAIFLVLGGVVLLFIDKWFSSNSLDKEEDISKLKTNYI